jgi:aspartyl/glutamyl-tRNA(Asn/Gln) amidotransferase C subunit
MSISEKDIEHLKNLARVEFGKAETEQLTHSMRDILGYIDILKEADVSGTQEMERANEVAKNVMRVDGIFSKVLANDDQHIAARNIIDAFPDKYDFGHGIYLKVKSIL